MDRSNWLFNWFVNLFFVKLTMLKVHSFLKKPGTWTTTISTNFANSKSLWLGILDAKILCQSLLIVFKSLSICKIGSKWWTNVSWINIFANQSLSWHESKHEFATITHLVRAQKVCFNTFKWVWKLSYAFEFLA